MSDLSSREAIDRFNDLWHMLEHLYDEYAKSMGLTAASLGVLNVIFEKPEDCTQKLISQHTFLPKQSVNTIIRTFWEQGYVDMKEVPADRRNKYIFFTEKGRVYANSVLGALWEAEQKALSHLNAEQKTAVLDLLGSYTRQLNEYMPYSKSAESKGGQ